MFEISEAFFKLPADAKAKYRFDLVRFLCLSTLCLWHLFVVPQHVIQGDVQSKNIGWESGQQKRASHHLPELKESLQLKWHDMEGRWPSDQDIADFQATCEVKFPLNTSSLCQSVNQSEVSLYCF